MQWKDIDLNAKEWRYLATKTDVQHIVPFTNIPGFSDKKPVIEQPEVKTFQRSFPQNPGKFCTLFKVYRS